MVGTSVKKLEHLGAHSISDFVDSLLHEALHSRASDIHIEPQERRMLVRFRIDGYLEDHTSFDLGIKSEVISRIKVLARLRTDEHQTPHDGRFSTKVEGKQIDVRVSIIPTYWGENAVLRLLSNQAEDFSLLDLGFNPIEEEKIVQALARPQGMILMSGPTGSGKTTTLYTIIKRLNSKERSIVTIEDPVEYAIEGITQIQIRPATGLTFSSGLRSVLRQDPDVLMVGEIRDKETAGIAVNTALTGHLLLSTVHTSEAAAVLPRLIDIGIDPYLVASTMSLVVGQRLLRKLCECKEKYKEKSSYFFRPKGCELCKGSGYQGRIGVNEVLAVDDEIRDAILAKASASHIRKIAIKNGMTTLIEDARRKAQQGHTSLAEVIRTLS
jgi:type II secretory ATPase GspE/PulE/Tfp pilus assembly ATPase PilB-like protein